MKLIRLLVVCIAVCLSSQVYAASYIYVSDAEGIEKYNADTGDYITNLIPNWVQGFVIGSDNNFYVGYGDGARRYSGTTGELIDIFAYNTSIDNAVDLAFGPDGNLYISSHVTSEIYRFNGSTGAFMDVFISSANGLNKPTGLTFGPDGKLYVCSHINGRILQCDINTKQVNVFASSIVYPHDLVFDSNDILYVTAYGNDTIYTYNLSGQSLGGIDSGGVLSYPYGITVDDDDNLYIANRTSVVFYDGSTFSQFSTHTYSSFVVFQTETVNAVPEPLSVSLLALGLLVHWRRKV